MQKRLKFNAKAEKGHLVGYSGNEDGFRVYVSEKDIVVIRRNIIFIEEKHVLLTVETGLMSLSDIESDTISSTSYQEDEMLLIKTISYQDCETESTLNNHKI